MQIAALAILGLILTIAGFILQFVLPDIGIIGWGMIALGIILLTSSFIIEFRRVRSAMVSHRGKYSASTTVLISVFIGIVLLVNAAGYNLYKAFDLTGVSQFTITSQTKDVLKNLDTPIDVICFFVPKIKNVDESLTTYYDTARMYAPALLAEYSNYTRKLNIKIYDPEERPDLAREYGLASEYHYQSVIFETELGRKFVSAVQIYAEGENAFTSAIMQVTGQKQRTVYFLTGHGEANPLDAANEAGYGNARKELRNNLFEVQALDLLTAGSVPEDCDLLVVAGPKTAMSESERNAIIDYLDRNGNAIFLTNPGSPTDIIEIADLWGFDVRNGTIIDPDSYAAPNKDTPAFNRITNVFQFTSLYFPGMTAVEIKEEIPQNMAPVPLLVTSQSAWMTDNFDPATEPKFDETKDYSQPETGMIAGLILRPDYDQETSTNTVTGPNIAVIGDSDFATNKHFYSGNNGEFFLRIVNQFTSGIEVTDLETKVLQTRKLILTPEKKNFLQVASLGLLPVSVLVIGFIVWWRRR